MPIRTYKCHRCGSMEEVLFLTFAEDERAEKKEVKNPRTCPYLSMDCDRTLCGGVMGRQIDLPGAPILFGDGFHHGSAQLGRQGLKCADPTKAAKEIVSEVGGKKLTKVVPR